MIGRSTAWQPAPEASMAEAVEKTEVAGRECR
jgi:hypothetical protein